MRDTPWPASQQGTQRDLIKYWKKIYTENQWYKYASFEPSGKFNRPYVLFKEKNIIDKKTRKEK